MTSLKDDLSRLMDISGKIRLKSITSSPVLVLDNDPISTSTISVAIIAILMIRDTRKQLAEQASQNERNQAAILQLLDEIADLAEGDLTPMIDMVFQLIAFFMVLRLYFCHAFRSAVNRTSSDASVICAWSLPNSLRILARSSGSRRMTKRQC